jgi:hypothetical protein
VNLQVAEGFIPTVSLDFDGVIHIYDEGWKDGAIYGDPMPGALRGIAKIQKTGAVVVHTCRDPDPVAAWLREHDVAARTMREIRLAEGPAHVEDAFWQRQDFVLVTQKKYPSVAYVDDLAIRFTSWPQTLGDLDRFTGWTPDEAA